MIATNLRWYDMKKIMIYLFFLILTSNLLACNLEEKEVIDEIDYLSVLEDVFEHYNTVESYTQSLKIGHDFDVLHKITTNEEYFLKHHRLMSFESYLDKSASHFYSRYVLDALWLREDSVEDDDLEIEYFSFLVWDVSLFTYSEEHYQLEEAYFDSFDIDYHFVSYTVILKENGFKKVLTEEVDDQVIEWHYHFYDLDDTLIPSLDTVNYYEGISFEQLSVWGLGQAVYQYVSNSKEYTWYVDQGRTGLHSMVNCGPASIEMAGRWQNEDFDYTASYARENFRSEGGWWYDSDISGALNLFDIQYTVTYIHSALNLRTAINQGDILLVNNDMSLITYNTRSEERVGRFYRGVTGHYLIVKGYIETDRGEFFKVYDPYSINRRYNDGTLMGSYRYYESVEFLKSIRNWYNRAYQITDLEN